MNKKRLIITSTISIILVTILMLGSTYSIFTSTDTDEELNVYTTGNLDITYTLDTENITFTDKMPINIEDQNTIVPYRITVENNGTVPYMFDLILEDTTSTEVIDYKYIMTKVGYLEPKSLSSCTDNIIKEDIILPTGESVDIDVRVWLSDTVKNTEMTKSFFAKLKVDGIAIYDKNEIIDNNILSLRYMKKLFQYVEATDTTEEDLDYSYFRSDDYRESIKNVSFVNYIDTTNKVISWDVSDSEDGSVIAWLENNNTSGYYDLYIGAEQIIFAKDLQLFFKDLTSVDSISFDNLDTSLVTNMQHMFSKTGYNSTMFSLNLGENFNTLNVTNMKAMFEYIGYSNTGFNLTLGSNFNTSNVEDMSWMFFQSGYNSNTFTLNLRDKFDTTNVTTMVSMFNRTGYSNPTFTLNLGEKFHTSNVTSMSNMFAMTGFNSSSFTLNLGKYFDTSNVTDMDFLFAYTGYPNNNLVLDLSTFTFDKVTNYNYIFEGFTTNKKIYVADATQQSWILDKGFTNLSTSNVLIKSS